jgi:response regulator of citrate/malate metabolism
VSAPLRVLVVEDEPVAAAAHTAYVGRVEGFEVAGTVRTGQAAMQALAEGGVDLVLLDMNLPDRHGLEIVRAMRAAGHTADVIAVTSARDLQVVRAAVSLGIVQYLLKPFVFASLRDRLERYRDYRLQVRADGAVVAQSEVDRAFASLRSASEGALPTGLSAETLEVVTRYVRASSPASALEVAAGCNISRVTARRYLEYLAQSRLLDRKQRHGGSGRPEIEYVWRAVQ